MSTFIEFRHLALSVDRLAGLREMQRICPDADEIHDYWYQDAGKVLFVEGGSNNTISHATGKVARSWTVLCAGISTTVAMGRLFDIAYDVECGMVSCNGRQVLAESYLSKRRKLLREAQPSESITDVMRLEFALDSDRIAAALAGPAQDLTTLYAQHLVRQGRLSFEARPYAAVGVTEPVLRIAARRCAESVGDLTWLLQVCASATTRGFDVLYRSAVSMGLTSVVDDIQLRTALFNARSRASRRA